MQALVRVIVATIVAAATLGNPMHGAGAAAAPPVDWGDLDTTGLIATGAAVDPATPLVFLLGLTPAGDREEYARRVSDPDSADYGRYLDIATAVSRFGASAETADAVVGSLRSAGVRADVDPTRTWAEVDITLGQARSLFATDWAEWAYPDSSTWRGVTMLYPTSAPTLPSPLAGSVDRVFGAVVWSGGAGAVGTGPLTTTSDRLPQPDGGGTPTVTGTRTGCSDALAVGGEGNGLTPNQLRTAYGLDSPAAAGLDGTGVDVAVVDQAYYRQSDLDTYRRCFGLEDATPVTTHVRGTPYPPNEEQNETVLDLSVLSMVAPAVDHLDLYLVGPRPEIESATASGAVAFLEMFAAPQWEAVRTGHMPDVVSASYGICETDPLDFRGQSALIGIFEQVLALNAVTGTTTAVSTMDTGSSSCQDSEEVSGRLFPEVVPSYPATSQWVTAVGGTNLTLAPDNTIESSGVWNDTDFVDEAQVLAYPALRIGGTGGTSGLVARPWYQDTVVPGETRAVPDVALFADNYPGYALYSDGWTAVGGTSAATPLFAGMVALLDQRARQTGQPRLGFTNPLIYRIARTDPSAFLDITLGNNNVFPEAPYGVTCCDAGTGFDLASGWGSPMATALLAALTPPELTLSARQSEPGSTDVVLSAGAQLHAGAIRSYRWDLNDDGTFDQTTTEPTLSVPGAGTIGSTLSPVVVATTTYGRVNFATTRLTLAPATADALLSLAG